MTMINLTPAGCDSYGTEPAQAVLLLNAAAMMELRSMRAPAPAGLASLPLVGGAL